MTQPLLDFKAACEWLAKKDERFRFVTYSDPEPFALHYLMGILRSGEITQDSLDQLMGMLGYIYWIMPETAFEMVGGMRMYQWPLGDEKCVWTALGQLVIGATVENRIDVEGIFPDKLTAALAAATQIIYKKYPPIDAGHDMITKEQPA